MVDTWVSLYAVTAAHCPWPVGLLRQETPFDYAQGRLFLRQGDIRVLERALYQLIAVNAGSSLQRITEH